MFTLLGLVIVFAGILGGYMWAGGPLHVLVQPAQLATEIETQHEEAGIPVSLIQRTGDSLPGLGIVAAVLGIVITMGSLDATPREIGHNVGAALVGTFLGILLCYGVFQPVATNIELQELASARYLRCIKEGVVAALTGPPPTF